MTESTPAAAHGSALPLFAPAVALGLLPLLLPASPWSVVALLLALPLHLAGAAWALGHHAESSRRELIQRRLWVVLGLLLAATALLAGVLAWPVLQLLATPSLGSSLLVSAAVGFAGVVLWTCWPAAVLPLIDPARGRRRPGPVATLATGRRLVQADPSAGRGLLATVLVLILLLGALGLGLVDGQLAASVRLLVFPLWSLLLAPLACFALAALVEPARLAASPGSTASSAPPVAQVEPELLLPAGLDSTMRLYAVARSGRVDLALAELAAGANPHALPDPAQRDQRTLPMLAAVLGDLRLLRALIGHGVDLNRRHAGLTPLLAATRDSLHGRPDAVMTLLANGADPRAADAEGRTPLHFAALLADPELAALLIDANADLDACSRDGYSPLGVACGSGNWRMARFLLERRAKPEPAGGQPALLAAAAGEDDPTGVQLLLRHKANVNARGRLGRSALMNACLAGNAQLVDALLAAGARVDEHDDHQVTPLLEAARAGATSVIQRLAKAGPEPNCRDHGGRNALLLACQSPQSDADTVAALVQLGVDPAGTANDGRRALDVAVANGRWPLVAVLDPSHALPSSHDHAAPESPTPEPLDDPRPWRERAHAALLDDDIGALDALLRDSPDAGVCGELFDSLGARLRLPLRQRLAAVIEAHGQEAGVDRFWRCVDAADLDGVALLLERGATPGGRGGLARHLRACRQHGQSGPRAEAQALALLDAGADGFARCAADAPLTLCLQLGWTRLFDELLHRGADPHACDSRGESALMIATCRACLSALPALLRHGAQPDAPTADGRTARGAALAKGRPDIVDWLDWAGWRLPGRPLRESDLVSAAALGDRAAVRRLLALGLPLDGIDAQGASALLRASGSGHAELVADLLAAGADAGRAAGSGATCLSAAVSRRQLGVIAVLLRHGVSADQPLPGEITPLMVAAALGFPEVCRALLDAGASAKARDNRGNGVLHALAQFGFSSRERSRVLSCWDLLLESGAEPDARNAEGLSPLLLLLGSRMEPGASADEDCLSAQVDRLLRAGVALDVRDGRGFGPLHLAALHGQIRVARRLLQAGADRNARDTLNRRPQDIALMRGFVDIARELEPDSAGEPPSMARLLRDPSQ
jgi:ankyrin repeat protein